MGKCLRIILSLVAPAALLFFSAMADAVDRNAASCSQADVATAIGLAQAGDVVKLPACVVNWSTPLVATIPANVTIQGAGTTAQGGGNVTVIQDNYASNSALMDLTIGSTGAMRMEKLTIRGGTGAVKYNGVLQISTSGASFVGGYLTWNMQTYSPSNNSTTIRFFGTHGKGVIYQSKFLLTGVGNGPSVNSTSYGGVGSNGDNSWAQPTNFGTDDFLFVEDSDFVADFKGAIVNDCGSGGRFVYRYNTMTVMMQTHPTGGSTRDRGCRAFEIYANTLTRANGDEINNCVWWSSGSGIVEGNTWTNCKWGVEFKSMRSDNATYPQTATPNGWGYCGTNFNGFGSNWDRNLSAATGKQCMDNPGQGQGDLLSGSHPTVTNTATGCTSNQACAWPRQATGEAYIFGNTWSCFQCGGQEVNSGYSTLTANSEYYVQTVSFNGTVGIGVGLLAARPSTCTTGVAYQATDNGTLYKCTATNTWSTLRTRYTYPHPLRSMLLSPPTNLQWRPL
jgi:hypothetical protein